MTIYGRTDTPKLSRILVFLVLSFKEWLLALRRCRAPSGRHQMALVAGPPKPILTCRLSAQGAPVRRAVAGRPRSTGAKLGPLSFKLFVPYWDATCDSLRRHPAIRKGQVMSKRENDANNIFRPSDSPLTEYEREQIALRKNLERLKAERLAREAAKSKND